MTSISRTCSIDDCDKPLHAKGLCDMHRARLKRNGHLGVAKVCPTICTEVGCGLPYLAKGLCRKHYNQQHHKTNWDLRYLQKKTYYIANREDLLEKRKIRHKDNPEQSRKAQAIRRAKLAKAVWEGFTEKAVLSSYGNHCYLCLEAIDLQAPRRVGAPGWEQGLHIEHVIPISKGGSHTLENVRPSHGLCNLRKGKNISPVFPRI